jgi:serine/threonine protein kinase
VYKSADATQPPRRGRGGTSGDDDIATDFAFLSCPRCGATYPTNYARCGLDKAKLVPQIKDLLIGTVVDRYLVFERIGDGSLGRVYRAANAFLEQEVALKVLHGHIASNQDAVERFRRSAQAASRIRHPNVAWMSEFGTTASGLIFAVMEFVHGRTLLALLEDKKPWKDSRAADVARQIAAGLEAFHAQGAVYRSLTSNHVIVGDDGGRDIAKLLESTAGSRGGRDGVDSTLDLDVPPGAATYMAPEQILGQRVDVRTDLYALGVILYQLVSGAPPFQGSSDREVLTKHVSQSPAPLPGSGRLGTIALDLLQKGPDKRPDSARAVLEALDRLGLSRPQNQPAPRMASDFDTDLGLACAEARTALKKRPKVAPAETGPGLPGEPGMSLRDLELPPERMISLPSGMVDAALGRKGFWSAFLGVLCAIGLVAGSVAWAYYKGGPLAKAFAFIGVDLHRLAPESGPGPAKGSSAPATASAAKTATAARTAKTATKTAEPPKVAERAKADEPPAPKVVEQPKIAEPPAPKVIERPKTAEPPAPKVTEGVSTASLPDAPEKAGAKPHGAKKSSSERAMDQALEHVGHAPKAKKPSPKPIPVPAHDKPEKSDPKPEKAEPKPEKAEPKPESDGDEIRLGPF